MRLKTGIIVMSVLVAFVCPVLGMGLSLCKIVPHSSIVGDERGNEFTRLPEVTVTPRKYSMLHLVYYVREFSSVTTYFDTVQLFREKTVDFMLPAKRERKDGWLKPRILASNSYYRFANYEGLDSVSDRFRAHFSLSDRISLFKTLELRENENLTSMEVIDEDNKILNVDFLHDISKRDLMPTVNGVLDNPDLEFLQFETKYYLNDIESSFATPLNLVRMDVDIKYENLGKNMNNIFKTKESRFVETHAEFYIVAVEYLDSSEARKWIKDPPKSSEIGIIVPTDAPSLPGFYTDLMARVNEIDVAKLRMEADEDKLLIGPRYNNFMTKNQNVVGKLWDKIKKLPNWLQKHI